MKTKNNRSTGRYADGFVIPVPKRNLAAYRKMSHFAGKIWMEYGALEYRECVGEDINMNFGMPFPKLAKSKKSETVVFSWIVYKSRAHRDRVNEKVMKDPRMGKEMNAKKMPFDIKKMSYGGFKIIVNFNV